MSWLRFFFGFRGRINRAKFWLVVPLFFGAWVIPTGLYEVFGHERQTHNADDMLGLVILGDFLVFFVTITALAAKRLHDRGRRGWWLLLYLPQPFIAAILPFDLLGDLSRGQVGALLYLPVLIWHAVELGCLPGKPEPNRYGPDPLKRDILATFD